MTDLCSWSRVLDDLCVNSKVMMNTWLHVNGCTESVLIHCGYAVLLRHIYNAWPWVEYIHCIHWG